MENKINVQLPDYLTIQHYKGLKEIKDYSSIDGFVDLLSLITEYTPDEIKTWDAGDATKLFKIITDKFEEAKPQFFAVIEFNDELLGFNPPSKMSLGEWIDLEYLLKDPTNNLAEICSILYRPITKKYYKNPVWRTKYNWKTLVLKQETNPFSVYDVEKYNAEKSKERQEAFNQFPIQVAQGALGFFLAFGLNYYQNIQTSLTTEEEKMMMTATKAVMMSVFQNTTDISSLYTTLHKLQSSTSPETKPLQT